MCSTIEKTDIEEIKRLYLSIQDKVRSRLDDFGRILKKDELDIFAELVFCILTPQSKARSCWIAVRNLLSKNLLLKGDKDQLVSELGEVRFKYKKAGYIIEARKQLSIDGKISIRSKISRFSDAHDAREWLVRNIKGLGYKEASHFLRNIGLGENLAILDRHILRNLELLGVIERIPNSLSRKKYLEIEGKMKKFAERVDIPMSHLDLVLWYRETGEIFK